MKKSYADECLERAEKASPGPWHIGHVSEVCELADINDVDGFLVAQVQSSDQTFVCNARTDVPELAKRLKMACDQLAILEGVLTRRMPVHPDYIKELREELEAEPSKV